MSHTNTSPFSSHPVFSHGFRLFFLIALGFGAVVIPYWLAVFYGLAKLHSPFNPVDWHSHEMIFGYAGAVITGFLFTAIPNWTGRLPIRGIRLIVLACLWLAGRWAMLGGGGLGPVWVMLLDCSFLAAVLWAAMQEIIAGRNWRNLAVLLPVSVLLAANILTHLEIMVNGVAGTGRTLGLGVVVFLITLIAGRVIPSFTRNWLVKQGAKTLPVPFNVFDKICLASGAAAVIVWVAAPETLLSAVLLLGAGVLHALRLLRWQGMQTLPSPLLFVLHLSYAFVPAGFFLIGLGMFVQGIHILGMGAIGGMTLAVIIRASTGHTGRTLEMSRLCLLGFVLIPVSAVVRATAVAGEAYYIHLLACSGALWAVGFCIVLFEIGPWLWGEPKAKRSANFLQHGA